MQQSVRGQRAKELGIPLKEKHMGKVKEEYSEPKLKVDENKNEVEIEQLTQDAKKVIDKLKGVDDVNSIKGIKGKGTRIVGSVTGKEFIFRPCSLNDIEEVTKQVNIFEAAVKGKGDDTPTAMMSFDNYAPVKAMLKLIKLGIADSEENGKEIGKHFSLGDFPKIYKIVLDLNDFLSGMRTLYQ